MTDLVLDSSAALSWGFADEATPAGDTLLREVHGGRRAWVPALWHLEVGNAMLSAKKRGRIDQAGIEKYFATLQDLGIEVDDQTMALAWSKTISLGETYGLSVYDAAYLELALRMGLPLATLDDALRAACAKAGVKVLL
jgi:predicted nucleic acid-binding protein